MNWAADYYNPLHCMSSTYPITQEDRRSTNRLLTYIKITHIILLINSINEKEGTEYASRGID